MEPMDKHIQAHIEPTAMKYWRCDPKTPVRITLMTSDLSLADPRWSVTGLEHEGQEREHTGPR